MAVMFDSEDTFGGALVVQVKLTQSHHSFREAMRLLQSAAIDRGTQIALLVYWSPNVSPHWSDSVPLVVGLDLATLPSRLQERSIVEIVTEERNRAIHAI